MPHWPIIRVCSSTKRYCGAIIVWYMAANIYRIIGTDCRLECMHSRVGGGGHRVLIWEASVVVAYDGTSFFGVAYCVEWSSVSRHAAWCATK